MAFGRVVVSTRIGAEGIMYKNGDNILIADDKKKFANYVIKVINDHKYREQIAYRAREHVFINYNIDEISDRLNNFYHKLLNKKSFK